MKKIFCLLFLSQSVFAQSSLEAYKLSKEKKWSEANAVAKKAVEAQPNDAEAWFILGLTEERLEHLSVAVDAYEKYLKLNPPPAAAQSVDARIKDLRPRSEQQSQDMYGKSSNGLFIEKQLSYKPDFVTEINGDVSAPISFGFRIGMVTLGYRNASGTYTENIRVPNFNSTPTYSTVSGGGKITHQELFANIYVSLVDPYTSMGNMQLALPITMGGFMNTLQANTSGTKYGNIGYDFGIGVALRGYTRSAFTWYAQGIYHLGIPFWGIREAGNDTGIQNATGDNVQGSISNFETSVGISYLFGEDLKRHY